MSEFLISWDSLGVEAIVPIGEWRAANIAAKLAMEKEPHNIGSTFNALLLRARFNGHRFPQVWGVNVDDSITEADLRSLPDQELVNLIKAHGVKFFGDHKEKSVIEY